VKDRYVPNLIISDCLLLDLQTADFLH
jgi:hypothetical protein